MTVDQKDLDQITNRVVRGYDPLAITVFGSHATGRANDESDIDLLILKDDLRRPVDRTREVRRLLFGISHPGSL